MNAAGKHHHPIMNDSYDKSRMSQPVCERRDGAGAVINHPNRRNQNLLAPNTNTQTGITHALRRR
jgi:hypothetical protein